MFFEWCYINIQLWLQQAYVQSTEGLPKMGAVAEPPEEALTRTERRGVLVWDSDALRVRPVAPTTPLVPPPALLLVPSRATDGTTRNGSSSVRADKPYVTCWHICEMESVGSVIGEASMIGLTERQKTSNIM